MIKHSELILNNDGSIFHLHLKPEHISTQIILVGDPARVDSIASYFSAIDFTIQNREFKTVTGWYNGKRLTIISTGIGTWGVNNSVAWGWAIINFVWWIGIGQDRKSVV